MLQIEALVLYTNLISHHYFPLTSTMTTDTPTDLSGATISCSNGVQSSEDYIMATLALQGKNEHIYHTCMANT